MVFTIYFRDGGVVQVFFDGKPDKHHPIDIQVFGKLVQMLDISRWDEKEYSFHLAGFGFLHEYHLSLLKYVCL